MNLRDLIEGFIPEELLLTWESQVSQYPAEGEPGISYRREVAESTPVDCLLWRDDAGVLRGVLNHFPEGSPCSDKPGDFNMLVDPEWRRQGIASALIQAADERWHLDFEQQRYSRAGHAVVHRYLTEKAS